MKKVQGDARFNLIKKILYDPKVKEIDPIRNKSQLQKQLNQSLTSSSSSTLSSSTTTSTTITSSTSDASDIIEQQYSLMLLKQQSEFIQKIKTKYSRMHLAFAKMPSELQQGCTTSTNYFNKQLRIPTTTPSKLGWDYNMDRNK